VREGGAAGTRIKTKGGKETLLRFEGEVVPGELELIPADPRKAGGFKKQVSLRPFRTELYEVKYEVRDTFFSVIQCSTDLTCFSMTKTPADPHLPRQS
jgi:hypothetical protein